MKSGKNGLRGRQRCTSVPYILYQDCVLSWKGKGILKTNARSNRVENSIFSLWDVVSALGLKILFSCVCLAGVEGHLQTALTTRTIFCLLYNLDICVVVIFIISGNFYFSFRSTSLAYITIPKNERNAKITEIKTNYNTCLQTCLCFTNLVKCVCSVCY